MPAHPDLAPATGALSTFTSTIRLRLRVPAKLRNLESVLLVLALLLDEAALVLVQLGALGHLEYGVLFLFALLGVLIIGTHITLRVVAPDADPLILPIITAGRHVQEQQQRQHQPLLLSPALAT